MKASCHDSESTARDCTAILRDLEHGAASLHTLCADFTSARLGESNLISAERWLVALQGLLIELRAHVPLGVELS